MTGSSKWEVRLRSSAQWVTRSDAAVVAMAAVWLGLFAAARMWPVLTWPVSIAYFGIGAVTTVACLRAATVASASGDGARTRAWQLFGWSALAIVASGVAWTVLQARMPGADTPWWSRAADQAYAPLILAGLAALPRRAGFRWLERDVVLDALMMLVGLSALAWYFSLRPLTQASFTPFDLFEALLSWTVVAALAWTYLRAEHAIDRAAIALMLVAQVTFIVSGFVLASGIRTYQVGDPVDLVFYAAWLARWAAARIASWPAPARAEVPGAAPYRSGIAPRLLLAAAFALLLYMVFADAYGRIGEALGLATVVLLMTGTMVARNALDLDRTARNAQAVADQKERFRAVMDSVTDFVFVIDGAGAVQWESVSTARAIAIRPGQQLADAAHPDDVAALRAWLPGESRAMAPYPLVLRLRRHDGGWAYTEVRGRDSRNDPMVRGIVLNGRDRSDEVTLEARVRHVEKLALLHDMAGRIAHAFNNVLTVVHGHTELLAADASLPPSLQSDVADMRTAANRGASITRQLLGFSGRQVVTPRAVNVAEVVDEAMPGWRRMLNRDMTVERHGDAGPWRAMVDRAQLEQVLLNLVVNARDAMPGGGAITVRVGNGALPSGDPGVTLAVADTGVGISPEHQARIFEPFFTTKSPGAGTGLGLAMVATIVRRCGGEISVVSAPGAGASFHVTLPATRDRQSGALRLPVTRAEDAPKLRGGTVLLVDDEDAVRAVAERILKRGGFTVRSCANGVEALAMLESAEGEVDVVVTDMMMPQMTGRELIARLAVSHPALPIVVITGFTADVDAREPLPGQVRQILEKPFQVQELIGAVRRAMDSDA